MPTTLCVQQHVGSTLPLDAPKTRRYVAASEIATKDEATLTRRAVVKEWFIYQGDGNPAGPFTTELLARGIVAGKVARDAFVACQGDSQWIGVMTVPEVAQTVEAIETSGAPVPPRPINTVPPAPAPKRDTTPEAMKPLFDFSSEKGGSKPVAPLAPPSYRSSPPVPIPPAPQAGHAPPPPTAKPAAPAGRPTPAPAPAAAPAAPASAPVATPAAAPAAAPAADIAPAAAAPAAPEAAAAAPAPPAQAAAEAKPAAEAKKEEPKPQPLPGKYKAIPYVIFGICVVLSLVVFGASRLLIVAAQTPNEITGPSK